MDDALGRALDLAEDIEKIPIHSYFTTDDGDVASTIYQSTRDAAVRFIAAASRLGIDELDDLLPGRDDCECFCMPDAASLITDLGIAIEFLRNFDSDAAEPLPLNENEWNAYRIIVRHNLEGEGISRDALVNEMGADKGEPFSMDTLRSVLKRLKNKRGIRTESRSGYFDPQILPPSE